MMRGRVFTLSVACVLLVTTTSALAVDAYSRESAAISSERRIHMFLDHPAVVDRIHATGMNASSIRRALGGLSNHERDRLADLLDRGWPGLDMARQVSLTADYLMLVALMRESRLFASVVSPLASSTDLPGAKRR